MQMSPMVPLSLLILFLPISTEVSSLAHYPKTGPKHVQNLLWKTAVSITCNPKEPFVQLWCSKSMSLLYQI